MESLPRAAHPEVEPEISTEHKILLAFGYGDRVDQPIRIGGSVATDAQGNVVTGRNFLDAYPPGFADKRTETLDILTGFLETDPLDEDYALYRSLIGERLQAFMGQPTPDAQ